MISPETSDQFNSELNAIGADVRSISEIPNDLTLNLPNHLTNAQPYERISCPGIIDIVMLRADSGKHIACFCFNGSMRTYQIEDESQLRAEVMRALKINIENHKNIEEATNDLEKFVKDNEGDKNFVTDFPADLENGERQGNFPHTYFARETRRQVMRINFSNGTTFLIEWPPSAKNYTSDVYKNGKYLVSNHDYDLSNLESILNRG